MKSIFKSFSKHFALGILSTSAIAAFGIVDIANAKNSSNTNSPQVSFEYSKDLNKKFHEDYGDKEKIEIEKIIINEISQLADDKIGKVTIYINDAIPNRPTFEQMSDNPSLSFQSFGLGGINLVAKTYDTNGNFIKDVKYHYNGFDLYSAQYDWIWSDVERGAYGLAKRIYQN